MTALKEKKIIEKMTTFNGPLGLLTRYFNEKVRIQVILRGAIGLSEDSFSCFTNSITDIRGKCCGYIRAFDRHMNMVSLFVVNKCRRLNTKCHCRYCRMLMKNTYVFVMRTPPTARS